METAGGCVPKTAPKGWMADPGVCLWHWHHRGAAFSLLIFMPCKGPGLTCCVSYRDTTLFLNRGSAWRLSLQTRSSLCGLVSILLSVTLRAALWEDEPATFHPLIWADAGQGRLRAWAELGL